MQLNVYLPDETETWLRKKAQEEVRSMSNYVQLLIERERQRERSLEAADLADRIPIP